MNEKRNEQTIEIHEQKRERGRRLKNSDAMNRLVVDSAHLRLLRPKN